MLVEITGKRNEEKIVTNSRIVAEKFNKEHSAVLKSIENLKEGIGKSSDTYFKLITKQNEQNKQYYKEYIMNRDGFSLLVMGFTGDKALKFKLDFINAFNMMEEDLKRIYKEREQWIIEREKGKLVRHILTDTIKMKIKESPNKKFMYPNYTKLIYKVLFDKSFNELKEMYKIKAKESLRDYLTSEELKELEQMEMLLSSLINIGWDYKSIKDFIIENYNKNKLETKHAKELSLGAF